MNPIQTRKLTFVEKMRKQYDSEAVSITVQKCLVILNTSRNTVEVRNKAYSMLCDLVELRKNRTSKQE